MSGNTINNSGIFGGAAVFQSSTINNAGQIAGTKAHGNDTARDELPALPQQLADVLKPVPTGKEDDAEATGAAAEDLVKEAAKDKPNKTRLRSLGEVLVSTAKTRGAAAPAALSIAEKVVELIGKIHRLA
jgi:hypothetical protein